MRKKDPLEEVRALEKEIGLSKDFLICLVNEDDWSFVIKLHALFEAVIGHALVEELGRAELRTIFANTELSGARAGKVEFAKALSILDKESRRYIRKLSELRNELVHDVTNTSFTFQQHLDGMNAKERHQFYQSFELQPAAGPMMLQGKSYPREEFFLQNPKVSLWLNASTVLTFLYQRKELGKTRRELDAKWADLAKRRALLPPLEDR